MGKPKLEKEPAFRAALVGPELPRKHRASQVPFSSLGLPIK